MTSRIRRTYYLHLLIEVPEIVSFNTADVKVLFVRVSVVALPTNVSVDVGKVIVPVFDIVEITGVVKVLFVRVCEPVNVVTVESILKVTPLPAPTESIPVPPANVKVSESKSIFNAPPVSP